VVVVESMDGFVAGEKISVRVVEPPKKAPLPRQDQEDTLPRHSFSLSLSPIP
jgi:hypothetical protein